MKNPGGALQDSILRSSLFHRGLTCVASRYALQLTDENTPQTPQDEFRVLKTLENVHSMDFIRHWYKMAEIFKYPFAELVGAWQHIARTADPNIESFEPKVMILRNLPNVGCTFDYIEKTFKGTIHGKFEPIQTFMPDGLIPFRSDRGKWVIRLEQSTPKTAISLKELPCHEREACTQLHIEAATLAHACEVPWNDVFPNATQLVCQVYGLGSWENLTGSKSTQIQYLQIKLIKTGLVPDKICNLITILERFPGLEFASLALKKAAEDIESTIPPMKEILTKDQYAQLRKQNPKLLFLNGASIK
jgi:hypothetical protein